METPRPVNGWITSASFSIVHSLNDKGDVIIHLLESPMPPATRNRASSLSDFMISVIDEVILGCRLATRRHRANAPCRVRSINSTHCYLIGLLGAFFL